jgi:hypothetical protein
MKKHLETEATQALRDTLNQISVIRVKEIQVEPHGRVDKTMIARVEIYGRTHVVVCRVAGNSDSAHLQRAFMDLRKLHARYAAGATPVLIAPVMSEEMQACCRESNTGFLDLEGNARIYLDEVFIVKRSWPHIKKTPPPAESLPTSETARFVHLA